MLRKITLPACFCTVSWLASVSLVGAATVQQTAASYVDLGDKFAHKRDFARAIGE
jgi:hypothetical protein